jgi:hypothetical protein
LNRCRFSIYIHMYTVFTPYLPSYALPPHTPPTTGTKPPGRTLFPNFVKEKNDFFCLRQLYRVMIVTFPCIYVL